MGTPQFSVPTLQALALAGHDIVAVYSQPARAAGRRGLDLVVTPVHKAAELLGLTVFTPTSFTQEECENFAALNLDAAVVVAYGLLLPPSILNAPRFGCYNGHASLLPRWRGAAPIQRAIMAGDHETGMMVMKMEEGLDTGPIALTQKVAISTTMTAGQLHDTLSIMSADLMVAAMSQLESQGTLPLLPQPNVGVTYAHKISKQETRIDWTKSAIEIERKIRGLAPYPAAWCEIDIGGRIERVKILSAQFEEPQSPNLSILCGDQKRLFLTKLQKAGGKMLETQEFLRGHPVRAIVSAHETRKG